ncbi:MAG: hypothetical protein ABIF85_06490 [Nanoarchaeota archaeon]|nr:hypothetical protein [Nanoarchaeota archaeon]MBU4300503.1 hypothetical protein [Nanoarchaeota archaeon]MBU4451983.1 hypothetical protein [Nanoarchaeota archaeon]MCG2724143.1 hypothetical protein [archaeon]
MYSLILKAAIVAAILKATNAFKWRAVIVYFLLSVFMIYFSGAQYAPERILVYTFEFFAAYVAIGIIKYRINRAKTKTPVYGGVTLSLNSLLLMFSMGYMFALSEINKYASFFVTMLLFFILNKNAYRKKMILFWKAVFMLSIIHSLIISGGRTLITPTYFVATYAVITHLFFAAKDAFSYAHSPEELTEGMMPAESIVQDNKKYIFGSTLFPSAFGLIRYVAGDILLKRRVVASFFVPLTKKNILEIRKIAKEHKRPFFLVQKEIDFLPFIVLGAIVALLTM